jgi:holo-[acyl-carrier protein] synthase
MIIGIGIDTVSVSRFEGIIARRGERFLRRVFSSFELSEGMKREGNGGFFASRFAAREAFVKALGTGFIPGAGLRDIGVMRGKGGKPELFVSDRLEEILKARGVTRRHLSISHDGDSAQAIVILEGA